jgi:hypothetical protein
METINSDCPTIAEEIIFNAYAWDKFPGPAKLPSKKTWDSIAGY